MLTHQPQGVHATTGVRYAQAARKTMSETAIEFHADPHSLAPLYLQLATAIERWIQSGRGGASVALPPERTLANDTGVSRITARKAIDHLVAAGLVVKRHGSGNYVLPRFEQPLTQLRSFSEELKQRGFTPGSRWLSRTLGPATPEQQMALQLSPTSIVARLERLRLANDIVMAYEYSVLPATVLPFPAAVGDSLYSYLKKHNTEPQRAVQHIRATNAGDVLADKMGVTAHQALVFVSRTGYDRNGRPVELTHSYCHSDFYDFVAELRQAP